MRSRISNFPVLISITSDDNLRTTANGGDVEHSLGYDIIFRDSVGLTQLDHEIEDYDGSNGKLVAWVRIPTLKCSDDTVIYMYYGNSCTIYPTENPEGVWDSNYKAVWHLKEDGDEIGYDYRDSTSNSNHGQGGKGVSEFVPSRVDGKIAYGQDFVIMPDSNSNDVDEGQLIDCGNDASLDIIGNQITLQAWVQHSLSTTCGCRAMSINALRGRGASNSTYQGKPIVSRPRQR